jgi:hypothetical protein
MSTISDSLMFLVTVRKTMCEFVDNSRLSEVDKVEGKNFIMNEASDYEIMGLAVNGEYPEEKYNQLKEEALFENVRSCVINNFDTFSDLLSERVATDFATDLTSLSEYGLTSCIPVMNFLMEGPGDYIKAGYKGATGYASRTAGRVGGLAKGAGSTVKSIAGKAGGKVSSAAGAVRGKTGAAYGVAKVKAGEFATRGKAAAQQSVDAVVRVAKTTKGKVIGGVLLASLIAFAAYKVYKAKYSAGAKACKGKTGPERDLCLKNFRNQAIKAQIQQLRSGLGGCAATSDPEKCRASLGKKIQKLEMKIR